MRTTAYLRLSLWEARGGWRQLVFFVACLSVGVGALVTVAGLSASLEGALRSDARELLAADLAAEARRVVPAGAEAVVNALAGARRVDTWELPALATTLDRRGRSLLVAVKAVEGPYPLYGRLTLSPPSPLASLLDDTSAVVAPEVLRRLDLRVGDALALGGKSFAIRATLGAEPDRLELDLTRGPRVLLSAAGLARTGLPPTAARLRHRILVALPTGRNAQVREAAQRLRRLFPESGGVRIETWEDAQPDLRRALRRTLPYLSLLALVSLLVGGVGVSQILRAWLAGRLDSVAVLRCLGLGPSAVVRLYGSQVVALSLVAGLVGAGLGQAVQWAGARAIRVSLGLSLETWQPWAQAQGIGLGVATALLFGLPALLNLRRIPPLRVLRRQAEPLPLGAGLRLGQGLTVGLGLLAAAWLQSGSIRLGLAFGAGVVAVVGSLALAAAALTRVVGGLSARLAGSPFWLRHGLRSVARGRADTVATVVGLGLGVLLLTAVFLVQGGLQEQLRTDLPRGAPSAFLFDVRESEWPSLKGFLERQGATRTQSQPVFLARLRSVDGRPVEALAAEVGDDPERRWALVREQRLTVFSQLPPGQELAAGTLWSDSGRPEVSVEQAFAKDLGARLGSLLSFDVGGRRVDLKVTSLRRVEWKAFGLHFFLAAEPGAFPVDPDFRAVETRLRGGGEQEFQDRLAAAFPGVTLLQVRDLLDRVGRALRRVGLGVEFLGAFTALAGLAILGAGAAATAARRGREAALLRALGLPPRLVALTLATEFGLLGLFAGVLGAAGGAVAGWAALSRGFQLGWRFRAGPLALAVLACTALTAAVGVGVCLPGLRRSVQDALRAE
ncbi:MAG: hypothetical protein HZB55_21030 [Deltaproteobacteria bacterium]|nr:hypothetical protein [Deltaproteobacteria bacterium]